MLAVITLQIEDQEMYLPPGSTDKGREKPPAGLIFRHLGHRDGSVVDFHWNPSSPWTVMSASTNTTGEGAGDGGGSLQVWRMMDVIYGSDGDVFGELKQHQDEILGVKRTSSMNVPYGDQREEPVVKEDLAKPNLSDHNNPSTTAW
ncbi:hypothetical protein CBR_g19890 [Chara braunii]|uniref:Uncharacterized protein n=1 Tax=Chara braunii TaxID=69332 RepID=A0A388KYW8_CHABU|nr:hypothetical protein CBR_g19890 [Chara braunii]|eukprot:GBG75256.1 hypothetical protein CBR_g19890 [Chara braunii]